MLVSLMSMPVKAVYPECAIDVIKKYPWPGPISR